MKITFVLPYAGMSGGIRVIGIHAERLMARGHEVFLISQPIKRIPKWQKVKALLAGRGWPKDWVPEPSHLEGTKVPHRIVERCRPVTDADVPDADVVVATHWSTAPWVQQLSRKKGAKAIFMQGYELSPGEENPSLDAAWRMPFHKIVLSRWLVEIARDKFGDSDISHVPNSVDLAQFFAPPRGRQANPTVGLLYSHSPFKACHVSLKAFELLSEKMPGVRLVTFGAEALDAKLPLPKDAEFTHRPAQDCIRNIYAKCDVWLCGNWREGYHLPALEAMACRCPVVSTRVGGPMDVIEDGVNGYLVEVGDSAALADRVERVLRMSEETWRRMSDAAHATATRYTWDDAAVLFEKALELAIEKQRGKAVSVTAS